LTTHLTLRRWGRSRIRLLGSLKHYNAIEKAGNINVRTLLLTGRYDYMTERMMKPWSQAVPAVEWVVLDKSSHMAHLEEPGRYLELLKDFLLSP
jgi:pimeloyl-ACP methyl ester carboxylesterase